MLEDGITAPGILSLILSAWRIAFNIKDRTRQEIDLINNVFFYPEVSLIIEKWGSVGYLVKTLLETSFSDLLLH